MLSGGFWARKRTLRSLVLIRFHLAVLTAFQIPNIIPPVLRCPGLAGLMIWQLVSRSSLFTPTSERKSEERSFPRVSTLSSPASKNSERLG